MENNLHASQKKLAMKLLKQGFIEFFGIEFDEKKIKRTPLGKPYYDDGKEYYFNISHCPDMVAVAVSKVSVGVDVEGMRQIKYGTVQKCCSLEEFSYVIDRNVSEPDNRAYLGKEEVKRFIQLWTLKESFVKMTGEGLRNPVNTIVFDINQFKKCGELMIGKKLQEKSSTSCFCFWQDFVLALSLQKNMEQSPYLIEWKEQKF